MPARQSLLLPWLMAFKALRTLVAFGVSAILQNEGGRVLLVRQRYSQGWHLPGGGVERGEPPAKAIIRECQMRLESFMVPKLVELIGELPKTSTGKIKKTDLK